MSSLTCTVPLSTLTSAPYNLIFTDSVFVTVSAENIMGSSGNSSPGGGAFIITKPDAPVNLLEDTAQRTASTLGL